MGTRMNKMMDDWMKIKYSQMTTGEFDDFIEEKIINLKKEIVRLKNRIKKLERENFHLSISHESLDGFEINNEDFSEFIRNDINEDIKEQARAERKNGDWGKGNFTEHHLPTKSIRYAK